MENRNLFKKSDFDRITRITLFEKFCLFFIKPITIFDKYENVTTVYKVFKRKMYILKQYIL